MGLISNSGSRLTGYAVDDHFRGFTKMIEIGKGGPAKQPQTQKQDQAGKSPSSSQSLKRRLGKRHILRLAPA